MIDYPSYSVAIRTLGTAGEKYQETLNSVARQTVKPERILVFIPWGYEQPKETVGIEEYIWCEKGMVSQRSLVNDEISSEFILFLDDDLSFNQDFVQILFDDLLSMEGDCICPDIYSIHKESLLIKIRDFLGGTLPHWNKEWSFKIRKDAHYSYNINPSKPVLPTQSGAGACILCRNTAYKAICYENERWLDRFHFGLGEDQLFIYKLYCYGYKVLTAFNAAIVHLNAGSGHYSDYERRYEASSFCRYVIWHRTVYSRANTKKWHLMCELSLLGSYLLYFPLELAIIIKQRSFAVYKAGREGVRKAKQFIDSETYSEIPSFFGTNG